jgi:hypothetical protein
MKLFFTDTRAAAALLVMLAASGGGCAQIKVEETHAEFVRSSTNQVCGSAIIGTAPSWNEQPLPMDTYVVQIFELTDTTALAQDESDCQRCLTTQTGCFLEQESCFCGSAVTPSPTELSTALTGMQLDISDYESLYCTRVLAVDRTAVGDAPSAACKCDPTWEAPSFLSGNARLCAISAPRAPGPLDIRLDVQCPSDGRSFSACLGM